MAKAIGRPTKLSAQRSERIVAAVRAGASQQVAAEAAGVARSTLRLWLAKGRSARASKAHRELVEAVERAGAQREVQAHAHIARAGAEDWRAEAWYLMYVRGYRHTARHELTGPDGGPVALAGDALGDLSLLSERQLAQLAELMEATHGER
jgi:hypothetical protein